MNAKIGIILGSTREGRVSESVGNWVLDQAKNTEGIDFEIVDIKDYNLPFLGTTSDMTNVGKWNNKLSELDGFIFVVAEYNHSITGALKNALDSARDPWINKAAGIVSYGSAGGARATEHLRSILAELQVADVRTHVLFSLFDDFENYSTFKPRNIHSDNLKTLVSQVKAWSLALKTLR
ncbi:MAG: NADPH-dependent oxidoreductase [Tenericutes bacterium HGW-Tenericutes-3]|nr:MAG: NADPH-dependent oxidoreductase [Tenericutes bacterium HGW-Tenericutes-3]